jgi:choline dehydrogenase-like flavoprotein
MPPPQQPLSDESRERILDALCDTFVPSLAGGDAFLARSSSSLGVPGAIGAGALGHVLDTVGTDFADLDLDGRTRRVQALLGAGGDGAVALRQVRATTIALFYGLVEDGRNPSWDAIGYPGPISQPPSPEESPKRIAVLDPGAGDTVLVADACVVGSGAGGAVVAARLQQAGLSVVVLEKGGYTSESDLLQLELHDGGRTYLNGGLFWSESGSIGMLAGSTLGGGTFVNSLVCLRLPQQIRDEWAAFGLDGLDGPEFDRHTDTVWERLGVNTDATVANPSNRLMTAALERMGHSWQLLPRNAGPHDPRYCGYCNAGCQRGEKQSTLVTYLQDAADAGARFVVGCTAERVLVEDGRTTGVAASVARPGGATRSLRVDAPVVVVAGGSIESPALLLHSGIGGPAVGKHLRLHPAWFVGGVHAGRLDAWTGQIQSVTSTDYTALPHGGGFLPECVILSPTFWGSSLPWRDGAAHKREMLKLSRVASWHAVTHDHGSGEVVLGSRGEAVVRWSLDDPVDLQTAAVAHAEMAKLHEAAGAEEIFTFDPPGLTWSRGDEPFGGFLERIAAVDYSRAVPYSAHQMCSCRMGSDPDTSVADGDGQLHDTAGVWIGDASALPTAPGVNPMIAIMALAERTAERILQARA